MALSDYIAEAMPYLERIARELCRALEPLEGASEIERACANSRGYVRGVLTNISSRARDEEGSGQRLDLDLDKRVQAADGLARKILAVNSLAEADALVASIKNWRTR